jgi:transmembrane sensor
MPPLDQFSKLSQDDWLRLVAFANGELSHAEVLVFTTELRVRPDLRDRLRAIQTINTVQRDIIFSTAVEHALARVRAAIGLDEGGQSRCTERPRGFFGIHTLRICVAAAMLVGVVSTYAVWTSGAPTRKTLEMTTRTGERAHYELPDGSLLDLAPQSHVRYTQTGKRRELMVSGEIAIRVVNAPARPFFVSSGAITARVLGTAFDIRRYRDERTTRIVVQSGRISTPRVVLEAGNSAVLDDHGGLVSFQRIADEPTPSWQRGYPAWSNTPVRDIIADIERWYPIHVDLADPELGTIRISGSFKGQSLPQAIEGITMSADLYAVQEGSHITLHRRKR